MNENILTSGTAVCQFMYCLKFIIDVNKKREVFYEV